MWRCTFKVGLLMQILTKSLAPLPEKWHGLADAEKRFRQRWASQPIKCNHCLCRSVKIIVTRNDLLSQARMDLSLQPMAEEDSLSRESTLLHEQGKFVGDNP